MASLINATPPLDPARPSPSPLVKGDAIDTADAYGSTKATLSAWLAKQQGQSSSAGLWDDATGLPTRTGLINALGQYSAALAAGTSAPGSAGAALAKGGIEAQVANLKMSRWGRDNQMFSVPVEYRKVPTVDPAAPSPKANFGIDENGQAFYAGPHYPDGIQLTRAIDAYLAPFGKDTYVRSAIKPDDYNYLSAGTHQGSMDRSGGPLGRDAPAPLGGLSVAHTPEFPANYGYLVRGDRIGSGTDSEPLLDVTTARPASPLMKWDEFSQMVRDAQDQRTKDLGLSQDEYRALVSGHKQIVVPK